MKACPSCGRLYPEDAGFCPVDGVGLIRASRAPVIPADDARVGQALAGRYQVRRVIADGGMGRVYEALDLAQSRSVAVKVLHAAVAADPVQIERFEREFSLSGLLVHPGIVRVLDFVELAGGERALVMELLYGEELKNTLAREGSLAPARVVRMVSQVAQALDVAHKQKLVHRDLKPDNLFLCQTAEGDTVKILDFGSVKDTARNARQLTALGTTLGSPSYMSPEQAQGATSLDHRADVWSLAVIAFEALTGQLPFTGQMPAQILLAIISKRPAVASRLGSSSGQALPTSVDRVLEQAFRKAPAGRFASAGALADALGLAFGLSGTHRDWATWPERRLTTEITAALPALLAAAPAQAPSAVDDFFGESGALE
jgi:serine/threonine protein kinase